MARGQSDGEHAPSHRTLSTIAESLHAAWQLIRHADAGLMQTVGLSLAVSGTACLCASGLGLIAGASLATARFRGQRALMLLLNTLLALPSVLVGLVVYLLLSRSGPLGSWGILFTPSAMVMAQTILVLPVVVVLTRQVVADGLEDGDDTLRSLGTSAPTRALLMLLHERWAVLTVVLTAFGRAIAEVGAVMIVGGNIDGVTRVMTTSMALETSKGDLPLAMALGLLLLAMVALINVMIFGARAWSARVPSKVGRSV
jgi:tungstate transport system permease protein